MITLEIDGDKVGHRLVLTGPGKCHPQSFSWILSEISCRKVTPMGPASPLFLEQAQHFSSNGGAPYSPSDIIKSGYQALGPLKGPIPDTHPDLCLIPLSLTSQLKVQAPCQYARPAPCLSFLLGLCPYTESHNESLCATMLLDSASIGAWEGREVLCPDSTKSILYVLEGLSIH